MYDFKVEVIVHHGFVTAPAHASLEGLGTIVLADLVESMVELDQARKPQVSCRRQLDEVAAELCAVCS